MLTEMGVGWKEWLAIDGGLEVVGAVGLRRKCPRVKHAPSFPECRRWSP